MSKRSGNPWLEDELDAIVGDYFDMLIAEVEGRPYVKAEHSRELMARIGRTHRSVEFKHQNISAVLEILGLPWISGYKPKANFQKSFDTSGAERFLEVKTTNGSARTPFYLTRNELNLAAERPTHWRVYRVHLFATFPRIFVAAPPLEPMFRLRAEVWRASL
jgi:hypothetical protein